MAVFTAVAKDAKQRGELEYAYSQGDGAFNYKDIGPWGDVRNGYCAALGFLWIQARLRGTDLAYDVHTRVAKKADWNVTRLHNMTKMPGIGYDGVLKELGMKKGAPTVFVGPPDAMLLVHHVCKVPGLFMLQYKRDAGGHLAAFHIVPDAKRGGFRYFDANYGHFVFDTQARFYAWYADLLTKGYAARYQVKTIVTGITWAAGGTAALRQRFGG
jgi:hypothetical protein